MTCPSPLLAPVTRAFCSCHVSFSPNEEEEREHQAEFCGRFFLLDLSGRVSGCAAKKVSPTVLTA